MAVRCEGYIIHGIDEKTRELFLNKDRLLEDFCTRVDVNMDFDDQIRIQKVLLEGAGSALGGETTEVDTDTALSENEAEPRYELTEKEHQKLKKYITIPKSAAPFTLPAP